MNQPNASHIDRLRGQPIEGDGPVTLYDDGGHAIYWVGAEENSAFRCNAYLLVHGETSVLFDPGSSAHHFAQVKRRVAQVIDPTTLTHIAVHHQDPDLCDSLPDWIATAPGVTLITTPRTRVLLPYYGFDPNVPWLDVSPQDMSSLELGDDELAFLTAPFLHFPEAMVTFDSRSGFLFTGDVCAAIEKDWTLVADDLEAHWNTMVPFHIFYMASQRALAGFIDKVRPFPISAIIPQHGSIIPGEMVPEVLDRLADLPCGIDLLYPASHMEKQLRGMRR